MHPSAMSISRFASRKREMETHAEVTVHAEAAVPAWGDNIFKAFCALFVCPLQPLFSLFLLVPFLFLFLHHLLLFFTKNRPSTLCTLWYNTHSDNNVNNVINKRNMINKMSLESTVYFGYYMACCMLLVHLWIRCNPDRQTGSIQTECEMREVRVFCHAFFFFWWHHFNYSFL